MLKQDLFYSLRSLRKNAGVTAVCILTLALGIGVNTALFTVVNTVLLRSMSYPESDRIVQVTRAFPGSGYFPAVSATTFDFWQRESRCFDAVSAVAYFPGGLNLTGRGEPERLQSLAVSADFFRVLGVRPMLGQSFTEPQDKPGAGHFAVLSYAAWKRLFNGNRNAIGQALMLGGSAYVITGVMPATFDFPEHAELWTPLQLQVDPSDRSNNYNVIARLRPGVSLAEAQSQMHVVASRLRERYGDMHMAPRESVGVIRYHDWIVGDVRRMLMILMGAVGFVLLLACANVANLLLARSASRQQELALRKALGATGWHLVSQLLIESLSLSFLGGLFGLCLAQIALPLIIRLAPIDLPLASQISVDWHVLLFAFGAAAITGIAFGVFPAAQAFRTDASSSLREGTLRTTASASSQRVRRALVVVEVAVSLVLLAAAGLLIDTVRHLSRVAPGFNPNNALVMQTSLTSDTYRSTKATTAFTHRVSSRLEALPGIQAVGIVNTLPFETGSDLPFEIIGHPTSLKNMPDELVRSVSPHYFDAMQIPLIAGRAFTETDRQGSPPVIIINQALARQYFKKGPVLGQSILIGKVMGPAWADAPRQVVGIVGDTSDLGLNRAPPSILFEPLAQMPDSINAFYNQAIPLRWVIRTSGDPVRSAELVRREAVTVSQGVPLASPQSLASLVDSSISQQRFGMRLLSLFAALALVLGAVGVYGVISYTVAQRTRELGVRSALGAGRADLFRLVVGQGMQLVGLGLTFGIAASMFAMRFLQSMLYGVTPADPVVLATASIVLLLVGMTACYVPARRAARIDPIVALRYE